MFHIKTKGEGAERHAEAEAVGVKTAGKTETLADDGVLVTAIDNTTGVLLVEDLTNENSAVISVHNAAGTPTPTKVNGAASIAVAKDNADTLNAYYEDGVVKVQNLLGEEIEVNVKAYA